MFLQLTVGSIVVSLTIVTVAVFVGVAIRVLTRIGLWLTMPPSAYKAIIALICVTLWLLAALTSSVWIWAAVYVGLGLFEALEPALYFSVTAFTTLGFGDITLPTPWRLLSGICAANGLLLFGLSTAFLVEFFMRLNQARSGSNQVT